MFIWQCKMHFQKTFGRNLARHHWNMREASTMDNLNCKMQAHARVCKDIKLEEKQLPVKMFCGWKIKSQRLHKMTCEAEHSALLTCDDSS